MSKTNKNMNALVGIFLATSLLVVNMAHAAPYSSPSATPTSVPNVISTVPPNLGCLTAPCAAVSRVVTSLNLNRNRVGPSNATISGCLKECQSLPSDGINAAEFKSACVDACSFALNNGNACVGNSAGNIGTYCLSIGNKNQQDGCMTGCDALCGDASDAC